MSCEAGGKVRHTLTPFDQLKGSVGVSGLLGQQEGREGRQGRAEACQRQEHELHIEGLTVLLDVCAVLSRYDYCRLRTIERETDRDRQCDGDPERENHPPATHGLNNDSSSPLETTRPATADLSL